MNAFLRRHASAWPRTFARSRDEVVCLDGLDRELRRACGRGLRCPRGGRLRSADPDTGVTKALESELAYGALDATLDDALKSFVKGDIRSVQVHGDPGTFFGGVYGPRFGDVVLEDWSGSVEGVEIGSSTFEELQSIGGVSYVALSLEECPDFEVPHVTTETFPWSDWRLVVGAVRGDDGRWTIRRNGSPARLSMIEITIDNTRRDGPPLRRTADLLLRVVAELSIVIDGRLLYREVEVPIVELCAQLWEWLEGGETRGDFSYDSMESETLGLLWIERREDGWQIGSAHQEYEETRRWRLEDLDRVMRDFVELVVRTAASQLAVDVRNTIVGR
jgi:hypothetical protein